MVAQVTGAYADIYTWENLYTAYRKAARGKRSRAPAATFAFRLEDNLIDLQDEERLPGRGHNRLCLR